MKYTIYYAVEKDPFTSYTKTGNIAAVEKDVEIFCDPTSGRNPYILYIHIERKDIKEKGLTSVLEQVSSELINVAFLKTLSVIKFDIPSSHEITEEEKKLIIEIENNAPSLEKMAITGEPASKKTACKFFSSTAASSLELTNSAAETSLN